MITPDLLHMNMYQRRESWSKKNYPEFWGFIKRTYTCGWNEATYRYWYKIEKIPTCPICGKELKFINWDLGYKTYCSTKCSNSDPIKKERAAQTCIQKYSGRSPLSSKSVRDKAKKTTIRLYGVEHAMKSDKVKDKYTQSCLKKYGCSNPMMVDDIKDRVKQTNIDRYGDWGMVVKNKGNAIKSRSDLLSIGDDNTWICECPHPECTLCTDRKYTTNSGIYRDRKANGIELCTRLVPIKESRIKDTTIELFIRDILSKHNIEYTTNNRTILMPREIDIYIPCKQIGIELNGVYSHCDRHKPRNYHIQKREECKHRGITLYQFWEDQIRNRPQVVESILLAKLGIYKTMIGARQCCIVENDPCVTQFLSDNHLQGATRFSISLSLVKDGEIVATMTFSKRRGCIGVKSADQWELSRYCCKKFTRISGGAQRLFKHFIKAYQPISIVSFSANDISSGQMYENLGFSKVGSNLSYWYIDRNKGLTRYHRSTFTKAKIKKNGWAPMDRDWTESDIMNEHGFLRIYDSGTTTWRYMVNNL